MITPSTQQQRRDQTATRLGTRSTLRARRLQRGSNSNHVLVCGQARAPTRAPATRQPCGSRGADHADHSSRRQQWIEVAGSLRAHRGSLALPAAMVVTGKQSGVARPSKKRSAHHLLDKRSQRQRLGGKLSRVSLALFFILLFCY